MKKMWKLWKKAGAGCGKFGGELSIFEGSKKVDIPRGARFARAFLTRISLVPEKQIYPGALASLAPFLT